MQIKEYRIVMPMSVEEYQIAQLYSVAEASLHETGGGEGVEVVKNEPFSNFPLLGGQYNAGQYTFKKYHLASRIPAFIRLLLPKGAMCIHEEAWNAYPYCRTVVSNPDYMKENFRIIIESLHLPDRGDKPNVHLLNAEQLKKREVVMIDIAYDPVSEKDYKREEDPSIFKSKNGRGALKKNWKANCSPVMTCYKLVYAEFKWFGIQNRVESFIHRVERRIFTKFHRQVFCWMDRWENLTMEDIRILEEKARENLEKGRKTGQVKGTTAEE